MACLYYDSHRLRLCDHAFLHDVRTDVQVVQGREGLVELNFYEHTDITVCSILSYFYAAHVSSQN